MELKAWQHIEAGQHIIAVNWNWTMRLLVFSNTSKYLGELEGVPQDNMMVVNGKARRFVEAEAAKHNLVVVESHDPCAKPYIFDLV